MRCTMDLCVAYDDLPSHGSGHLSAYIPSFGLSGQEAEASEAPLMDSKSNGKNSASFSVSSCCLVLLKGCRTYIASARLGISFIIRSASNALCFVLIPCSTFKSFPHFRTTIDCFLRNRHHLTD